MAAKKSPDAFRTISEVADWLGVNAHVLRFWESKFSQIKPVKRAGGRRYYRKSDMELLGGIQQLLHEDGLTIKGAQKVLREQGVKAVAALSKPVEEEQGDAPATGVDAPDAPITPARTTPVAVSDSETDTPAPQIAAEPSVSPEAADAARTGEPATMPDIPEEAEPEGQDTGAVAPATEADTDARQPALFDIEDGPAGRGAAGIPVAPLPPLPSERDAEHVAQTEMPLPFPDDAPDATSQPVAPRAPAAAPDKEPGIAPLPGPELSLTEALQRSLPGQLAAADLAPLLSRARALRDRMDAAHTR